MCISCILAALTPSFSPESPLLLTTTFLHQCIFALFDPPEFNLRVYVTMGLELPGGLTCGHVTEASDCSFPRILQ